MELKNKDYITIGGKLSDMLNLACLETDYEKIGREFVEQTGHDNPHELMKQLSFHECGLDVLEFALNHMDMIRKSNIVTVIYDDAKCVFVVYNKPDTEYEPAMVRELADFTDRFVLLSGLESRRTGAGEDLVIITIQRVGGRVPILIQAGCEYAGDFVLNMDETISRNKKLYERLGYRDVNNAIGNYENSVVMLHCDDTLYDEIMRSQI